MTIASAVARVEVVAPFLVALLAPIPVQAAPFDLSDVTLTAFASFSSQQVPEITASDLKTAPSDQPFLEAQVLIKQNLPFPNVPNSQNSGFASSAATISGSFGVGVNGFSFEQSLPPNNYLAAGTWAQSITNHTARTIGTTVEFVIPAPTIRFAGNIVETVRFDYGMHTLRDPGSGVLEALATTDAGGSLVPRFEEFDGSFRFSLAPVDLLDSSIVVGPGETLEFGYDYFATASTGFGEIGVFAAIGDPFDLSAGGSFSLRPFVPGIPEPGTLPCIALGLALVGVARLRRGWNARQ